MSNAKIYDEWGAFVTIPHQFIDHSAEYSDQARWLFVLLRRYTNGVSGKAFPSYAVITERTGWTNKTIAKAIKELESGGWIARQKQFSGPTIYTLTRPQNVPQGTNDSSSHREQMQFPVGTTVVPVGTSKKTDNKKTNSKKTECGESSTAISAKPHTPQTEDAVSIALTYFPTMGIWQQELIANADINHLALWRQTMQIWSDHKHSRNNIHGMIDKYQRLETQNIRDKEYQNGKNGSTTRQTAGERKASEYLELQRKLGASASNDPDYKPLPGFEWLDAIR